MILRFYLDSCIHSYVQSSLTGYQKEGVIPPLAPVCAHVILHVIEGKVVPISACWNPPLVLLFSSMHSLVS